MENSLLAIESKLKHLLETQEYDDNYNIPSLWLVPYENTGIIKVDPVNFFLNRIDLIREISGGKNNTLKKRKWSGEAVVYNMFVRHACAFDHDLDGTLSYGNTLKFNETGTLLKAIAMLPYIKSLGANTIYLLPITSIGIDGRKGTLGSPYAIKHHYELDNNISEPLLGSDPDMEFTAFVEAAHLLGIRVVTEFVFRTASIDSDLAKDHPDWFYWIKDEIFDRPHDSENERMYGPPIFTKDELVQIKEKVGKDDFDELIPPHDVFRKMFTEPPGKVFKEGNKLKGMVNGQKVRIPCAFSDWTPDDRQPPWSDVTYLKLYDHPDFNYIAYNTVRMYDNELAKPENRQPELWETISNVVPFFQGKYGIDGVMIDMGHALPPELQSEIIGRAKRRKKNFTFWEENFVLSENSLREGYNAVVGYMMFDQHDPKKINELLKSLDQEGTPVPFFLTPETHNTPRAATKPGGIQYSKLSWAMNCLLPGLLFIHAGFDLGEKFPVNTGLHFTEEELKRYPQDKLPLFSEAALQWDSENDITEFMRQIMDIRKKYYPKIMNYSPVGLTHPECSNPNIVSFIRRQWKFISGLVFIGNWHPEQEIYFEVKIPKAKTLTDVFTGAEYKVINGGFLWHLKPFEFFIGEVK